MTESSGPDERSDPAAEAERPAPSRTAARPSPTSRARRTAAAAAPEGLRRPRPSPRPAPAVASPAAASPAVASPAVASPQAGGTAAGSITAAEDATGSAATGSAAATDVAGRADAPTAAVTVADGAQPHPTSGAVGASRTATKVDEGIAVGAEEGAEEGRTEGKGAGEAESLDARPADLVSDRQPAGSRVPAWLVAALAVVVLALAALDGWLLTSQPGPGSRAEREQALSTAKTAVPLILSYNYRRFDADVAAARARLTGRAVNDYVKAMTTTIKPTATKVRAVVQAQTDGAGVEAVSGDGDQVTVVVFGQQKVTNTSLTAPRIDLFRVRVTLDRVQGQWLVSKFDQI